MRTKISNFILGLITSGDNLLEKYQVKKPLGHGSFGNVYLVNDIQATKQEYNSVINNLLSKTSNSFRILLYNLRKAMKILDFGEVTLDSEEIKTLTQTKNENVLRYLEVSNIEILSNKHSIIITEFCEVKDTNKSDIYLNRSL